MSHCNGWQFIERWLEKRNLRQCELADYLGVSTAAITQIKNGNIRLSSGKMEKILQFFDVQEWEREEFYHEIFTARIQTTGKNRANVSESLPVTSINASRPLINFSILDQFAHSRRRQRESGFANVPSEIIFFPSGRPAFLPLLPKLALPVCHLVERLFFSSAQSELCAKVTAYW